MAAAVVVAVRLADLAVAVEAAEDTVEAAEVEAAELASAPAFRRTALVRTFHPVESNDELVFTVVTILFPGLIIGKGGARIKDIEYKVGCSVRVRNDGNGNHFAEVQGTEDQYKQVQDIISDTVERQKTRGQY